MDHSSARDFLYGFSGDQYNDACTALGLTGQLRYTGAPDKTSPANDQYWAKITTRVVDEHQETLRNGETRRFCSDGLVFVQLFCPVVDSQVLGRMDKLAEFVRNSFRRYQSDDVEFTNATITDNVAPEPNWLRTNIVSNYAYRQFIS